MGRQPRRLIAFSTFNHTHLESYDKDPGWFDKPAGTLAETASPDELKRDLGFVPAMEHGKGGAGHQHGQG